MPEPRPIGPILKIATPVALLTWTAVIIAAFWGLDWRWIPTTLIGLVALLLVGGYAEVQLERRAERRELERRFAELLNSPNAWNTTLLPPDQTR